MRGLEPSSQQGPCQNFQGQFDAVHISEPSGEVDIDPVGREVTLADLDAMARTVCGLIDNTAVVLTHSLPIVSDFEVALSVTRSLNVPTHQTCDKTHLSG